MLVVAKTQKSGVAEFVVFGALDETDLDHDFGANPVSTQAISDFASRTNFGSRADVTRIRDRGQGCDLRFKRLWVKT